MTIQAGPKAQNLIAALATATGCDCDNLMQKARRLREAGLFVKETRSPKSPRPTPRDIAHLLVTMLADAPAKYADEAVEHANLLRLSDGGRHYVRDRATFPWPFDVLQRDDHSFIDFLEALVAASIKNPLDFTFVHGAFSGIEIGFNKKNFCAVATIRFWQPGTILSFRASHGGMVLDSENPAPVADFSACYVAADSRFADSAPSGWRSLEEMDSVVIAAIGRAFVRDGSR